MPYQPYVHVQGACPLHAPEGHATKTPDGKGGAPGTGQPRAGEDEPESTRDNDERIAATSHKGGHHDQKGCDEHAADPGTPEERKPDPS